MKGMACSYIKKTPAHKNPIHVVWRKA